MDGPIPRGPAPDPIEPGRAGRARRAPGRPPVLQLHQVHGSAVHVVGGAESERLQIGDALVSVTLLPAWSSSLPTVPRSPWAAQRASTPPSMPDGGGWLPA